MEQRRDVTIPLSERSSLGLVQVTFYSDTDCGIDRSYQFSAFTSQGGRALTAGDRPRVLDDGLELGVGLTLGGRRAPGPTGRTTSARAGW